MSDLRLDLRLVLRSLRRRPGFAATVIVTLAVGLGANLAFFGYASYFLAPTIEAPAPERVVRVHTGTREAPDGACSYLDWLDLRAGGAAVFARMPAYQVFGTALIGDARTLHAWGTAVSGEYFALFGRPAQVGRLLAASDDRPGAERVLVLNDFYWHRHFGGDPGVLSRTVELDGGKRYRIVGVTAKGFQGDGLATSIYVPLATAEGLVRGLDQRTSRRLQVLGRLAPGVSLAAARSAMAARARGLDQAHPEEEPRQISLAPVTEMDAALRTDPTVVAARGLAIAVGLLLLLACANVANLMLVQAVSERRELAIHAALGAGRWRLGRRLLAEGLVLTLAGAVLGLGVARGIRSVIERYLLAGVPVGMGDWSAGSSLIADPRRMTLFFATLALGTALLVSLAPLAATLRRDLASALKSHREGDRGRRAGGARLTLRNLLVVVQVALSVVLLLAAGLLIRTQAAVRDQGLGFDPAGVTLVTLHIPTARGTDNAAGLALYRAILEEVRALPGVGAAGLAWRVPLVGFGTVDEVTLAGADQPIEVAFNVVSPEYFQALGLERLAGRTLTAGDRTGAPGAVVINQTAADELFRGRQPIGQRLKVAADDVEGGEVEVVGVVADARFARPAEPIRPYLYYSWAQRFRQRLTLVVRAHEPRAPIARPLAELLRRRFPDVAVVDAQPMREQVRRATADQTMNADLATGFGLFGLGLAALGIASVLSYTVARSGRAIGVRMALGASPGRVGRSVLAWAGRLVAVGIALGLAAAWALARLIAGLLYGVRAGDPWIALAVVALLATAALAAAVAPALRAARVEPVSALRGE